MYKRILHFSALSVWLVFAGPVAAFNNTSLEWQTIKTPHFEVHYHQGAKWTAEQVARIVEEINGPITELYQYEPDYPVHFIIRDTHDYANGAAYFYENKVEIWATNLEFGFRGTTDWLRNVVTHEYTHIISIQAGTRLPKRIPAAYFQAISFEDEKRADVLQGYPKNIITFPFSGIMMPPWFAEGVAQYQSPDVQFDCWDAHRDMILRCAVLEDKMLTYDQMGFFGKNGLQAEQVYDHGYGLVNYIASEYGANAIQQTTKGLKTIYHLNMNGALKAGTGKKGQDLYNEWKAHLAERYAEQTAPIHLNERAGNVIAEGGYMTVAPALSPDGKEVAYLSNAGYDYSTTSLYMKPLGEKRGKFLKGGVSSAPQFSPDGTKLVYSRKEQIDRYGSVVNDIYVWDIKRKKEKRLTKKSRAGQPDFSPDGSRIVAVVNTDGTHKMILMDIEGKNQTTLLERAKGTQIYNPHFSPDGQRIVFGIFDGATRDIATVSAAGSDFQYLLNTPNDERDARWVSDAKIVFASDRTGVFNLYAMDLQSGWVEQRSNVIGGAFLPDMSRDGQTIVYTSYSGDGYSVSQLDGGGDPIQTLDSAAYAQHAAGKFDECERLRSDAAARHEGGTALALASGDGGMVTNETADAAQPGAQTSGGDSVLASSKYKSAYTPFHIYPRIVIWDKTLRLGAAASSFEILDKQSLFFGASFGTDKEFDGFVSYEISNFYPTLFVDGLYVRERTTDTGYDDTPLSPSFRHSFDFNLRYDLWIADVGLRLDLSERYSLTYQNQLSLYWSHSEYSVNIDGEEFDEDGLLVTPFDGGWKYYVGNQLNLKWTHRRVGRAIDASINPRGGRHVSFWYMRAWDDLFEDGEFEYGFKPQFSANNYNQFTVDWREFMPLPWWRHTLRLRLYGSLLEGRDLDSFFWVYMGGRDGIRGYNYYSIGGRKGAVASATYRFPIVRNIDKQFLSMYFRDVYGSVFYEAAAAWDGLPRFPGEKVWKDSAGFELRFSLGAYYLFPTSVSIVSAYGFDPTFFLDTSFDLNRIVEQEPGWTYYLTIGFDFEM